MSSTETLKRLYIKEPGLERKTTGTDPDLESSDKEKGKENRDARGGEGGL